MDQQSRQLTKQFALQQIQSLELLVKAIDMAEGLHSQLMDTNALVSEYSADLQAAQARIGEDEATIQFKDNQLKVAESDVKDLKLSNKTLEMENNRLKGAVIRYEDSTAALKQKIKELEEQK